MQIPEDKREKNRRNTWSNNDWEFPQVNVRHQTTDWGISDNTKQYKWQQNFLHLGISFIENQTYEKILKETRGKKNTLLIEEQS